MKKIKAHHIHANDLPKDFGKIIFNIPALPPTYNKALKERKFTIRNPNGQKNQEA